MAGEQDEKGFVIKDRRRFSEDGEKIDAGEPGDESKGKPVREESSPKQSPEAETSEDTKASGTAPDAGPESHQPFTIDFSGFAFSLYSSAAFHFGDMADPATGKKEKNLVAAKQMIDILAMLQEKTRGNLTDDEQGTLEALLYELRMRYVKET